MAHLVEDITKYFNFEDVDIDNWGFKVFSKGCVILFFAGSMVGVMSQYFGEPIQCDFKGIDGDTAKDFCWIHGSSYIPPQYQQHMQCIADLRDVESKEDAPDTSYYQWVTFMQLFQAGMFMLPPRIWSSLEGGLMQSFGMEGKSVVMLTEEAKYEDGVIMEVILEKFTKYFRSILHHNQRYFFYFCLMEILNIILVYFNFWATDQFLQGRFKYFGYDVIRFFMMSKAERERAVNPFCATFPKEISCDVPAIGPAGGKQWHNALCVLSQNVINEKIYLALWFYIAFACAFSVVYLFYRVCTILFAPLRFYLIYASIYHSKDPELRASLKYVLSKCYIGDWFVLLQLQRNVNLYFFRAFVKELRKELKGRPKISRMYPTAELTEERMAELRNIAQTQTEAAAMAEKEKLDTAMAEAAETPQRSKGKKKRNWIKQYPKVDDGIGEDYDDDDDGVGDDEGLSDVYEDDEENDDIEHNGARIEPPSDEELEPGERSSLLFSDQPDSNV